MTLEFDRQELQALARLPISSLPNYVDDWPVTCSVGKVISASSWLTPWNAFHQLTLEITLSEP